jgi:hypothetical protein
VCQAFFASGFLLRKDRFARKDFSHQDFCRAGTVLHRKIPPHKAFFASGFLPRKDRFAWKDFSASGPFFHA